MQRPVRSRKFLQCEQPRLVVQLLVTPLLVLGFADGVSAASDAAMRDSLEDFASSWMQGMVREADRDRARARFVQPASNAKVLETRYRTYGDDVDARLKSTGNSRAPYVGLITYTEHTWVCRGGHSGLDCQIVESSPITEIFPYREGAWRY